MDRIRKVFFAFFIFETIYIRELLWVKILKRFVKKNDKLLNSEVLRT
jgi:hypothetical protein